MREHTMTPVLQILQNVVGSCDFGEVDDYPGDNEDDRRTAFWQRLMSTKCSDTGFGHLVESILRDGFSNSAIGWYWDEDEQTGEITEGHHRIAAAILLGLDEVPTTSHGLSGDHKPAPGAPYDWFSAHSHPDEYPIEVDW